MNSRYDFRYSALNWIVVLGLLLQSAGLASPISANAQSSTEVFASGLWGPFGMAFDSAGYLYVANEGSGGDGDGVSRVAPDASVSTFATGLNGAAGVAFNRAGVLHVSDDTHAVFQVDSPGNLSLLVDPTVGLANPNAIAFDQADNLYVVSAGGFVSKFDAARALINLNLACGFNIPEAVTVAEDAGVLFISDRDGNIFQIDKETGDTTLYTLTYAFTEGGLARDSAGNLYLSAFNDGMVLRVDASDQAVTTCLSGLSQPRGLAFDSAGNLYVTSYDTGVIYRASGCGAAEPPPPAPPSNFTVEVTNDQLWGDQWSPNSTIPLTIDGGAPYTAPTDEWGHFHLNLRGQFDLYTGQMVTASDGVTTKTQTVAHLTVTTVDPNVDTVSGTATPGSEVEVDVWGSGPTRGTTAPDGSWLADFGALGVDIALGANGHAQQNDADGDATRVDWQVPHPRIGAWLYEVPGPGLEDYIESDGWPVGVPVTLTIDDPSNGPGVDYTETHIADPSLCCNPPAAVHFDLADVFPLHPPRRVPF